MTFLWGSATTIDSAKQAVSPQPGSFAIDDFAEIVLQKWRCNLGDGWDDSRLHRRFIDIYPELANSSGILQAIFISLITQGENFRVKHFRILLSTKLMT
ncbi:hypothetical protein ACNKHR_03910 [Shigella flexneri]